MAPAAKLAFNRIWKSWAFRKASITAWKIVKGRIATADELEKRGVSSGPNFLSCKLCLEDPESVSHLFFSCKMASSLWSSILKWLGVAMALHSNPFIHFLQFSDCLGKGKFSKIASSLWIITVWSIWTARNDTVFNNVVFNLDRVFVSIQIKLWHLITCREASLSNFNLSTWLGVPWICLNSLIHDP